MFIFIFQLVYNRWNNNYYVLVVDKTANPEKSCENQNEGVKKNTQSDQLGFKL